MKNSSHEIIAEEDTWYQRKNILRLWYNALEAATMMNKTNSPATLLRMSVYPVHHFIVYLKKLHLQSLSCLGVIYTYLEQMTSWEVWAAGSSFSRLLERSIDCRWRRPQGTTEGRAVRQLDDRSRCVIRDDRSMNQSSSNQGSCRPLQNTLTACTHVDIRSNQPTIQSYFCCVTPWRQCQSGFQCDPVEFPPACLKECQRHRLPPLTCSSSVDEVSSTFCLRRFLQKAGWSIRV